MPASIGINLRVTGHCRQGGRKYMEDCFSVAYQQTDDERDLEYAFFGIYDGHGGAEAAAFAKEHLMDIIVRHKSFWSDNDEDVLKAIKDGYIATHYAMWKEQEKWPKTASGLPSTAGTTASVAFIRRGKIYVGHVGDSRIILGYQEPESKEWKAKALTKDHKPESVMEMARIEQCGGKVVAKSGVPRVVWNRPRIGHKGPVRRSTMIDEIPFLAVARSLGDLWSYNSQLDEFVVSPEPDCSVIAIDTNSFRCLIFGTDGLYNMLSSQMAVHIVQQAERHNEDAALSDAPQKVWLNPSKCLVEEALGRWSTTKMRADNTTVVTVMLDPPGPPRAQVLKNRKKNYSDSGLQIVTRYESQEVSQNDLSENHLENQPNEIISKVTEPAMSCNDANVIDFSNNYANTCNSQDDKSEISCSSQIFTKNVPEMFDTNFIPQPRESLGFDPTGTSNLAELDSSDVVNTVMGSTVLQAKTVSEEENIQINEISSSSMETEYQKETITNEYSQLRVTKRRNIGKTKRILNSSENFQHIKISQTQTTIESCKELDVGCCNNKILSDSNSTKTVACAEDVEIPKKIKGNTSNDEESSGVNKVVTRSKSNISYKDETAKENNTPRQKTKDVKHKTVSSTTNQIVKETRLTRKRNLESAGVLPLKKPKVQVITKPAVVRKITRQSVLNSSKATKDETAKNVQYSKSRNMNNVKLANNNVERSVNKQRTPRKTSQLMNLPPTRKRSAVEKKLPKSNETKKLDNNNKKNVMKEHRQLSIKTRSNTKSGPCHHLRRSRK